ncbi:MAG: chromosome segregation protein SMC [Clostridiales bacterium]|nr:chromosome segregation protein SMC [Clostridiales bacterium]
MFLKRLEVFGFKSFAERLDISFSNGITAIVGPNGSGKSNVSDAVRWVLGEQSAKQLRGANMADVIFKGTEARKPLSYCEVSLVFDNEDKGLDIEFSEVVITRRLYRSGESEYYINRTGCRLKDIVQLFQDTGIGKEGYSIVGQGKIENILSGKQDVRRAVFEEAAGIVKYRSRKEEAERKLQHTQDNLTRINDIIDTLEERIEPLSQQAETAKEYLQFREQLRTIEVNFYLIQNELAEQKRANFVNMLEGIDQEKNEKTQQVEKIISENASLEQQVLNKEAELSYIRNELLELTKGNENLSGQISVLDERIQNLISGIERVKNELESNEKRKKSMEDAINGDAGVEEEKKQAIEDKKSEIKSLEEDIATRDEILNNESAELEQLKAEMLSNMNKLSDVKSNISRLNAMKTSISQRKEKIAILSEQIRLQKVNIEEALKDQLTDTEEYDREKTRLTKEKEELKTKWQELYLERDNASENLQRLKQELNGAQSRLHVLEELKRDFEGFNHAVRNLLTKSQQDLEIKSHISGVLAQLISVPQKYEVAIEAALGSAMQNIVTPTEEDAKALIEYLRRHDLGRATFLPISAVKGRVLEGNEGDVIKMQGSFGLASDLIAYDSIYSEVVKSLLGRTVIVDDLDTGISIQRKTGHALKVVTLKGDVMNTGGSMSGGSLRQKTTSILGREREIEQLNAVIKETNLEISRINGIVENFDIKYTEFENQVKQKDDELHALDIKFAHDIEKLNKLKADLKLSEDSENEIKLENEQLDDTLKEIDEELENINTLEGDFENSNSEKGESISARQIEYNKKQLEREKLFQKLTDARVECAGLEKELDTMVNNANRLGELIENLNQAKVKILAEGVSLEKQLEEARKEKEDSISKTGVMQEDLLKIQEKEKIEEGNREQINNLIKENEEKRRHFEQEIYEAGERRHKVELQQSKVDNDLQYLENRIWEEYELTQATCEEFRDPEFKVTGAQTEINRLKKSISALGHVNVNAIDEYVETKERFDDLSSQRDDLVKAENDLRQIIEELIKKMDKQFKEQFELINKHFAKTFSELFGGGKAELKLQDGETSLDADIEIVAQPPGKSLQLLSLLSGGERALTAIAILFAMLKLKPTPFCILDEIEAALDEANVGNFATYLRKFSKDTQFIVITHRKPTMEEADSLYGVAMEEKGISKIVSVKLT